MQKKVNIMYFTERELTAMAKMAGAMALADGRGDAKEAALIARELTSLSNGYNTENVVKAADRMEVDESLRILRGLTNEEKKYVCGFLAAILQADNNISNSEIKAWQVVCSLAAFPTMTFAEAVGFWATH